jgi:DnaK suppressor protein
MSRSTLPSPRHAALSAGQLEVLRAMLNQQREFRLDQLAALRRRNPRSPLGSSNREITVTLTMAAHAALQDVVEALWRMDEGRYGVCVQCAGPVEIERLEILPQTALCMACQRSPSE